MNEWTRKQATYLLVGIFLGYSLFQITSTTIKSLEEPKIKVKNYGYARETVTAQVDDYKLFFSIIPRYEFTWRARPETGALFNISLVNPTDEIRWVDLIQNYYRIEILQNDTVLYRFNSEPDKVVEPEVAFLAPRGMYTLFFYWTGAYENDFGRHYFLDGVYDIRCVFVLNGQEILVEGLTFKSYTTIESPGMVV